MRLIGMGLVQSNRSKFGTKQWEWIWYKVMRVKCTYDVTYEKQLKKWSSFSNGEI